MAAPCDGCCWCFCSINVFGLADLILVLLLAALGRCSLFLGLPESGRLVAFSCSLSERRPPPFWIGFELPGL